MNPVAYDPAVKAPDANREIIRQSRSIGIITLFSYPYLAHEMLL